MITKDYIEEIMKTATVELTCEMDEEMRTLLHGISGIATEGGELLDHLKSVMFYGKSLNKINIYEEFGDIFYFIALICKLYGWQFSNIMKDNIEKVQKRYPNGFSEDDALDRDKENELKHIQRIDKLPLSVCITCKVPPTINADAGKFFYSCNVCMKGAPDGRSEDEASLEWNRSNKLRPVPKGDKD